LPAGMQTVSEAKERSLVRYIERHHRHLIAGAMHLQASA